MSYQNTNLTSSRTIDCSISERLLLHLSREPGSDDYAAGTEKWNPETALSILCRVFPNFRERIFEKEILDFGCGTGHQAVAFAKCGAKYVLGIDTNLSRLNQARSLAQQLGLEGTVEFADRLEGHSRGKFDLVISQNSMEHYPDPFSILKVMKDALNRNGSILITFGPPWYAPYGSHMHFFTKMPWVNILFSERSVMRVRSFFRDDGATRYEEVESGLNKMTIAKFEKLVASSGMKLHDRKYECVRGLNFLARTGLVRELFINHVTAVLTFDCPSSSK